MKAAINGTLNVSILDGWWNEGYAPERGWRIGNGEEYSDAGYQDMVESQALYNVLENDVIPTFYDRTAGKMPEEWIAKMKASIKMAMSYFCSHRMVGEYQQRFYLPAVQRRRELFNDGAREAKRLSVLNQRLKKLWSDIRLEQPQRDNDGPFQVDDSFNVSIIVHMGAIQPDEVDVELYFGHLKRIDELEKGFSLPMEMIENRGGGTYLYRCTVHCTDSGRYGFTVRVVPRADDWIRFTPGLLTWA